MVLMVFDVHKLTKSTKQLIKKRKKNETKYIKQQKNLL